MVVKFIGGPLNGQTREIQDRYAEWRVPIQPKMPTDWSGTGELDLSMAPSFREEVYRKGSMHGGLVHFVHESLDVRIHEQVESMNWPEEINA